MYLSDSAYKLLKYIKKHPHCTEESIKNNGEKPLRELFHHKLIESSFVTQEDAEDFLILSDLGDAYLDTRRRELHLWAIPIILSGIAIIISIIALIKPLGTVDINLTNPSITVATASSAQLK